MTICIGCADGKPIVGLSQRRIARKRPGRAGHAGPNETSCCELPSGSRVNRGNCTRKSCLQQPTRTVRIGHGSPPIDCGMLAAAASQALPNRRESQRDSRERAWPTHRPFDVSRSPIRSSPPGSFFRKRLSGNAWVASSDASGSATTRSASRNESRPGRTEE